MLWRATFIALMVLFQGALASHRAVAQQVTDQICRSYAGEAVQHQERNIRMNCGYPAGPRWSNSYEMHFSWCTSHRRYNALVSEHNERTNALARCQSGLSIRRPDSDARPSYQYGPGRARGYLRSPNGQLIASSTPYAGQPQSVHYRVFSEDRSIYFDTHDEFGSINDVKDGSFSADSRYFAAAYIMRNRRTGSRFEEYVWIGVWDVRSERLVYRTKSYSSRRRQRLSTQLQEALARAATSGQQYRPTVPNEPAESARPQQPTDFLRFVERSGEQPKAGSFCIGSSRFLELCSSSGEPIIAQVTFSFRGSGSGSRRVVLEANECVLIAQRLCGGQIEGKIDGAWFGTWHECRPGEIPVEP